MCQKHTLAWTALLFALLLTGCGTSQTVVTKFQHFTTPPELRDCLAEPKVKSLTGDDQLAGYILDLKVAGADCRSKLEKRNEIEQADGPAEER